MTSYLLDIDGYHDLYYNSSCLDGWFTADELRRVANAMDELAKKPTTEDALRAELARYKERVTELTEKLNENYEPLRKELERLGLENAQTEYGYAIELMRIQELYTDVETRADSAEAEARDLRIEVERLREALENIESWSQAYPIDIFPEPDFKRVRELLEAGGITIDSVSASNMRHVVEGVGNIARAALAGKEPDANTADRRS